MCTSRRDPTAEGVRAAASKNRMAMRQCTAAEIVMNALFQLIELRYTTLHNTISTHTSVVSIVVDSIHTHHSSTDLV